MGWLVLYIWNNSKNSAGKTLVQSDDGTSLETDAQTDTDNDGLLDWEEELWRTNSELMDTDGDGTNDGDEVKVGRNPKIAGTCSDNNCSDKLQNPEELSTHSTSSGQEKPSTFTAKIAQEFGKNYFAGKGVVGGEALSAQAQQSLADSMILGIEQGVAAYQDVFKKEDIKISEFLSPKIYLDKLGEAFNKNFKNISTSELNMIELVISGENFQNTKLFDPLIEAYKNMVLFLQKETVSKSYAELHLSALNIMQNTLFSIRSMKNIEEDPVKAIVGIRLYQKETERAQEFLKNLKTQVMSDKINFTENDGGYFFKQYFDAI